MKKDEIIKTLREKEDVEFDPERYEHLVNEVGIHYRRAAALILAEHGYSHTGIARILDVNDSTGKNYLKQLKNEHGENAVLSKPISDDQKVDYLYP